MISTDQYIPVLHLNWRFDIGGAETHIVELCKHQRKIGIYPIVICQDLRNKAYLARFKKEKIPFYELKRLQDIKKVINKYRIKLIHAHSSTTYPLATKIAQQCNLPLIGTLHGPGAVQKLDQITLDAAIAISNEVYHLLKRKKPTLDISIITNGVDTNRFRALRKKQTPHIAYVGRVDAVKIDGVRTLHQAINQLNNKVSYICLSTLKKQKGIHLPGKLIRGKIDSSKVLHHTDIVIGTGRAIMEGMSAGNVGIILGEYYDGIVTPSKINPLLHYNLSGRLLRKKATVKDLVRDLETLLQNREQLEELQRWSANYAQNHFHIKERTSKHKELYVRLLNKAK